MANILQVTTPSVNTDNRTILDSQEARNHAAGQRIQNPVDPTRVVRADGQEEGKSGTATGEGTYNVIDFASNYGAFVQKLSEGLKLPALLQQLLFQDLAGYLFADREAGGVLLEQLLAAIRVNTPEELLEFLKGQEGLQAKFTGPFFDGLRMIMNQNSSDTLKEAVMAFLRGCNDYSTGSHILKQMRTLTDDIGHLMLKQFRTDYTELLKAMNWEAENGDTAANTAVLNSRLIPFLSAYISRTHDYGSVRDAVMLLIYNAVKYENGGEERLWQLFDKMADNRDFAFLYKGDARADLQSALAAMGNRSMGDNFADLFSKLLLRGANGQAGLENIQQFYTIMNTMLLNESVYMPLLHLLVPFQYRGKEVMSEIWADPDAETDKPEEGRRIKMLLKFDVRTLGNFELVLSLQNRQIDMQLYVPAMMKEKAEEIQVNVSDIFKKNGFGLNRLLVREKTGELRIEDVFPEIREKERTINVRI